MFNVYIWKNAFKELVGTFEDERDALNYVENMGAIDITADPEYAGCYDVTDKQYRLLCIEPMGFKIKA